MMSQNKIYNKFFIFLDFLSSVEIKLIPSFKTSKNINVFILLIGGLLYSSKL